MCNKLDQHHIDSMIPRIKAAVEKGIIDSQVEVVDRIGNGHHFNINVISEKFNGLQLVKQHQMVMDALKELLSEDLHAVIIKTKAL